MTDLIKALQIFLKYKDDHNPTHCEHDTLMVNVEPSVVSPEDIVELEKLGFFPTTVGHFESFRFGSC